MNISELKSQIRELKKELDNVGENEYTTWRDEDGYLFIKYKKDGVVERFPRFDLRPYQIEVQKKVCLEGCRNTFMHWTRRAGKEVICFVLMNSMAIESPMLCGMIYPTTKAAEKIIWTGGIYLEGVLNTFIDILPRRLFKKPPNNKTFQIYYSNGSVISMYGVNYDPDKVRGTNERFLILAEAAFQDPRVREIISPILTENNGILMVQSTYDGSNHFYQLGEAVKDDPDWLYTNYTAITLTNEHGERYITDEMIDKDRRAGMPEFMIQQEYYGVVQNNEESNYYAAAMTFITNTGRIIPNLMMHNQPVYAGYDLGKNDSMVCTLFQINPDNYELIIIWCHSESGKNFDHFLKLSKEFCIKNKLYLHTTFVPHDGTRTSYYSDENAVTVGESMGENVVIVESPGPNKKIETIHICRDMLKKTRFNQEHTSSLRNALSSYKKEFDKRLNIYKDYPMHNWASHYADSYQTIALAIIRGMVQNRTTDVVYYNH